MLNLDKNKTYLLACSYGPDSMALFSMLEEEGYKFAVAHVCYNLRCEAKKETSDLKNYCEKHNVPIYIYDVKESLGTSNIEAKCREIRYKFFKKTYDLQGFSSLLVAHHQDDHIETYLLQKHRRNFVEHYGLNYQTNIFGMDVIRPLLSFTKQDLLDYCLENKIPYAIDSSNLEDKYLRNQIRHNVIANLNDEDRLKLLNEISNKNNKLNKLKEKLQNVNLCDNASLLKLTDKELAYALNFLIKKRQLELYISKGSSKEIRKVLLSNKPNVRIPFSKNIVFEKSYTSCNFVFVNDEDNFFQYVLEKPDLLDTPYFYLNFQNTSENRNVHLSDYPLTIRNAKNDDIVIIKNYEVKVRRLFIDWKMPMQLRNRWPVIVNKDNKVIYIPRYQKDFVQNEQLNFYVK